MEISARMSPHFPDRDPLPFLNAQSMQMFPCHGKPFFPTRPGKDFSCFQICIHRPENPRISPCCSADSNCRTSGFLHQCLCRRAVPHIPVSDDRNMDGIHNLFDFSPVCRSHIKIFPCPTMDRNGCRPCRFRCHCQFYGIDRIPRPAQTHFYGNRNLHRCCYR